MENFDIKIPENKIECLNLLKACLAAIDDLEKIIDKNSEYLSSREFKKAA